MLEEHQVGLLQDLNWERQWSVLWRFSLALYSGLQKVVTNALWAQSEEVKFLLPHPVIWEHSR